MDTIKVMLHTPLDGFANELCDVIKLFFAVEGFLVNSAENAEAETILHTYEEKDGEAVCTFTFRGETETHTAILPQEKDYANQNEKYLVAHKRISKRLCKVTLYELLKRVTGKLPTDFKRQE